MTTSWNETKQIEAYILGTANTGDALVFEARLLLDNDLANKVLWQQNTYRTIHQFGRRQLKKEIEIVHHKLFSHPQHRSFSQKIRQLFVKQ